MELEQIDFRGFQVVVDKSSSKHSSQPCVHHLGSVQILGRWGGLDGLSLLLFYEAGLIWLGALQCFAVQTIIQISDLFGGVIGV